MQDEAQAVLTPPRRRGRSYLGLSLGRLMRKKVAVACISVIVVMYGSGVLAPLVTPYGYNDQNLAAVKERPSWSHPFGRDEVGRDYLTRIIYGLRTTVIVTVAALLGGSLLLGITLGLMAGYFGKKIDSVIMRTGEVTSAFPDILLVLIIVATVKPRIITWVRGLEDTLGLDIIRLGIVDYAVISLALAVFSWFGMARLVRGQVLQAREFQYVEAARAIGNSTPRILLRHVLPNVIGPVIVVVSAGLATFAGVRNLPQLVGHRNSTPDPEPWRHDF